MYKREGGLLLCECGHLKAYHGEHAMWHGGPLHTGCVLCYTAPGAPLGCKEFKKGEYQGLRMELEGK